LPHTQCKIRFYYFVLKSELFFSIEIIIKKFENFYVKSVKKYVLVTKNKCYSLQRSHLRLATRRCQVNLNFPATGQWRPVRRPCRSSGRMATRSSTIRTTRNSKQTSARPAGTSCPSGHSSLLRN
jgi:hypothetical protein